MSRAHTSPTRAFAAAVAPVGAVIDLTGDEPSRFELPLVIIGGAVGLALGAVLRFRRRSQPGDDPWSPSGGTGLTDRPVVDQPVAAPPPGRVF
ncbi:MAG: hypothetical protein ACR2JP_00230 [Acidimicrobiia bacterium]